VNASGGIAGHPVELTIGDDGGNPGTSVTTVQGFISSGVDVILDATPLDAAWAQTALQANVPVVGGELTSDVYTKYSNFYPSGQTIDALAYSIADVAKLASAPNFGMLYCAEAPSCQEAITPTRAAGAKLGVPLIYTSSIAATQPNYTAQCVAANQAKVSALFISHAATVFARVGQDCNQQNYKPMYLEAGTGFTMNLASTPGVKDNLWITFPVLPFFADKPPVQQMNSVLDHYYPGLRNDPNLWSEFQVQTWTGGKLIEAGVKAAGLGSSSNVTAAEVTNGLNSLKDETLGGWSPPLTFTAGQPHPVHCWFTARVQNGTPSMTNNDQLSCLPTS
jgi:branched-chain amino acid transport system substrate-binding protein